MGQRKAFIAIQLLLVIVSANGSNLITCHCTAGSAGCINNTCTVDTASGSCHIALQGRTNPILFQDCLSIIWSFQCVGSLEYNPSSSVPFEMCCLNSFCNSAEVFHALVNETIRSLSPSISSTTTPVNPTTTTTNIKITTMASITSSKTAVLSWPVSTASSPLTVAGSSTSSLLCDTCSTKITSSTTNIITGSTADSGSGTPPAYAIGIIVVLAILLAAFVVVILVVIFLHFYPRHVIGAMSVESDGTPTCTLSTECGEADDNLLKPGFEGTTSGSGSGLPQLIQRSVAAQVTLQEVIGKGRFGEVRKGVYKGDSVAVKIFHTKEEASWNHEVDIYQTCLIRHPNILRFIAADNKDIGIMTQLWLITEYCEFGSLYDVLQEEPLNENIILKLCYTAASGLAHLHSDIIGTEGKPAIAHRDLKTRNILVKSDFSCCLADLGLSLRYYRDTDKVEEPPTKRVGTRRYLSPEILNDTMDVNNFDCFKRSDMYSFGLVVWETARKGICAGTYEDYQLPYFDLVNPDPSFEDMRKVVAFDKKRPTIPNRWSQSEVFHGLSQLMEQCWYHDGEARVTALRVKKNLSNLQSAKLKQMKNPITTTST